MKFFLYLLQTYFLLTLNKLMHVLLAYLCRRHLCIVIDTYINCKTSFYANFSKSTYVDKINIRHLSYNF